MYLTGSIHSHSTGYILRQSVKLKGVYTARDLFDLGSDPSAYICYAGGNSFYLEEGLVETVRSRAEGFTYEDLEDILWPFVDPGVKRALRGFRHRGLSRDGLGKLGRTEEELIRETVHRIDKQRLNYLRLGTLDQTRVGAVPAKLYRPFLYKSRDEIEQYFLKLEKDLKPTEHAFYCYSFLNLRRFFSEIHAGKMPQALDQEELDKLFVRELCRLNEDSAFWAGLERTYDRLHPYLIRYAVMFFDSSFGPSSYLQDILLDFIARQRFHRSPPRRETMPRDEVASAFQLPHAKLRTMSRHELTRHYRRLAKKLHPDQGGESDAFIRLNQAYVQLMKQKKSN